MYRKLAIARLISFVAMLANSMALAELSFLQTAEQSRCLDGSPFGIYFGAGYGVNSTKWVIKLGSGGFCNSESSCSLRIRTDRGSSKSWPPTLSGPVYKLLSDYQPNNPDFYDWNHVYIPYCTGDFHSGTVTDSQTGPLPGYYFSGHNNVRAAIILLSDSRNFGGASVVIVTGGSAGGFGTFVNADWIADRAPLAQTWAVPAGGLFLRTMNFEQWSDWDLEYLNSQGKSKMKKMLATNHFENSQHSHKIDHPKIPKNNSKNNYLFLGDDFDGDHCEFNQRSDMWEMYRAYAGPRCLSAAGDNPHWCLEPTFLGMHMLTPIFIAQNLYDTDQIFNLGRSPIPPKLEFPLTPPLSEYVNYFGMCTRFAIHKLLAANKKNAVFAPACLGHMLAETVSAGSQVDGMTFRESLTQWLLNGRQEVLWMEFSPNSGGYCAPPDDVTPEYSEIEAYKKEKQEQRELRDDLDRTKRGNRSN